MPNGVAINVGVNTRSEWGGFRGPIFHNGYFEFIHIPWKGGMVEPPPKKYKDMQYASYVPERLKDEYVARSPDFDNCCYASSAGAVANDLIFDRLGQGGYLLFYATLKFHGDPGQRLDDYQWINPGWGAYIIGYFKIDSICRRSEVLLNEKCREAFKEYDFYKLLQRQDCFGGFNPEETECQQCVDAKCCSQSPEVFGQSANSSAPWVKGIKYENGKKVSCLINPAIPLSRAERGNSQKWSALAQELFRNPRGGELGKRAGFRTPITCEGKCLEKLLAKCVLRRNDCEPL